MGLENLLYKVYKEIHRARLITSSARRAKVKNLDKKNVQNSKNLKKKIRPCESVI